MSKCSALRDLVGKSENHQYDPARRIYENMLLYIYIYIGGSGLCDRSDRSWPGNLSIIDPETRYVGLLIFVNDQYLRIYADNARVLVTRAQLFSYHI